MPNSLIHSAILPLQISMPCHLHKHLGMRRHRSQHLASRRTGSVCVCVCVCVCVLGGGYCLRTGQQCLASVSMQHRQQRLQAFIHLKEHKEAGRNSSRSCSCPPGSWPSLTPLRQVAGSWHRPPLHSLLTQSHCVKHEFPNLHAA